MTPSMPAKPSTQMEILLGKMHKVQEMIDEFFTRFDVMNTDIKTVSDEVHILHKQVLDFGEDMDNIKCCIHINDKPVSSSAAGLRCDRSPVGHRLRVRRNIDSYTGLVQFIRDVYFKKTIGIS